MPSQALQDPRNERAANDELPAPHGRCGVCHAPLPPPPARSGGRRQWCSVRCRMFAWRRGGDPDGQLDYSRSNTY